MTVTVTAAISPELRALCEAAENYHKAFVLTPFGWKSDKPVSTTDLTIAALNFANRNKTDD